MIALTLFIALISLLVGCATFWANPKRFLNKGFFFISLMVSAWLLLVYKALMAGHRFAIDPNSNPVPWLRANNALAAFFPWILWVLQESVVTTTDRSRKLLLGSLPWLVTGALLAGLCFTDLFIPSDSTPDNSRTGAAYSIYYGVSGMLYLVLLAIAFSRLRKQSGIKKIELQFLTINGSLSGLAIIALSFLSSVLELRILSRLGPLIILCFYGLTAWAVTIHRIFDARQVFLSVSQRISMIVTVTTSILGSWQLFGKALPTPLDLVFSIAICSTLGFWLDRRSRGWFNLNVWQNTTAIRQSALDLARREPDPNKLITEFEALLRGWYQTNYAALLFDSGEVYVANNIELGKERTGFRALLRQGWSTPESLQRMRPEPGLVDLRQFLTEFNLGLIVPAPRGSTNPSLLLALGIKTNFRPFTYPEVQQLQEVAEFMDNILARSRLSMQARQSEQLATIGLIGASLAHEIRNPLVSIKTFSHLLATRFDDPEFRRRFSVLIPAEVERIDSLTQQLLDLSNPRRHQMERLSLHTIMQETADLMLARAQEANVTLTSQLTAPADAIHADGSAIRQVLINLIINAFQALENQTGERRVQLRSRNSPNGSVILEVSDNGPGIAPEQRARLFHPFVSTKTKGMGLGLAVCADILHEHRATIIVPDLGRPGATFRITFPCPQPSS
jgi:signal transduction histidine kinase